MTVPTPPEEATELTRSREQDTGRSNVPETGLPTTIDPRRFLRILEDPWFSTLVEVQDLITFETAVFWRGRGVRNVHLPVTTGSVSSPMGLGSDSLPVEVELFGARTFLADSMQFLLEYGCRLAEHGTYYLMPSFRGEPADDTHLNQFFHSEAEIPGGLDEVIATADAYVRHLAQAALDQLGPRIAAAAGGTRHVEDFLHTDTARLTFDEAAQILAGDAASIRSTDGRREITRHGERRLIDKLGPAVWLTHYDRRSVPFYQAYEGEDGTARNADLLLGPGEILGCGERHVTADQVRGALRDHRVAEDDYAWYVEMKSEHPLLTSGFGMGVERFVMWLLAEKDIRRIQIAERYNGVPTLP
ncbi:asparagine synthetase A [Streptomyces anulatus]